MGAIRTQSSDRRARETWNLSRKVGAARPKPCLVNIVLQSAELAEIMVQHGQTGRGDVSCAWAASGRRHIGTAKLAERAQETHNAVPTPMPYHSNANKVQGIIQGQAPNAHFRAQLRATPRSPLRAAHGPTSPRSGQGWPNASEFRPGSTGVGPTLADVGSNSARFRMSRQSCAQLWRTSARTPGIKPGVVPERVLTAVASTRARGAEHVRIPPQPKWAQDLGWVLLGAGCLWDVACGDRPLSARILFDRRLTHCMSSTACTAILQDSSTPRVLLVSVACVCKWPARAFKHKS